MKKVRPFRYWFYLRQGYSIYFTFLFASINVLTVTYYLAIENIPILKNVFPTFSAYVILAVVVGVPTLIIAGYIHFRRISAYKSEVEVTYTSNPYVYKLPPGWMLNVQFPYHLQSLKMLTKLAKNEKLDEKDLKTIEDLEKKINHLLKGGYVGEYKQKDKPSSSNYEDK